MTTRRLPEGGARLITDAAVEAITLHADGTFGVMFRRDGSARVECTCGWEAPCLRSKTS